MPPGIVPPGRIVGLDVARCVALVGMIATHTLPAFDADGLAAGHQVAAGRASALFAVLAGVSLALMTGRSRPLRGAALGRAALGLAVRAVLIAGIGLLLGDLRSGIAVILTYYGVLFLLGLPFLGLSARTLAVLSGVWLVVVPVLSHLLRPHLPPRGYDSPTLEHLTDPWSLLSELTFTGYYPAVPWLAYLLAGMALGRTDLSRWGTTAGLGVLGAGLAALGWSVSAVLLARPGVMSQLRGTFEGPRPADTLAGSLEHGLYGATPTGSWWWLAVQSPHTATPFDLLHTIGTSLVVVALALAVARLLPGASAVVFGAGAMTLTLYSLHVVLRAPWALPGDSVRMFWVHTGIVLVLGAGFRLARSRGPLEALIGWLSRTSAGPLGR